MNRFLRISFLVLSVLVAAQALYAQPAGSIIVDAAGKGRFRTIQAAVNSLADSSGKQSIIFIRKGVYNEKLMLAKSGFILQGEDSATTIITQSIARDEWRCTHESDWGVATVNITGNDITL